MDKLFYMKKALELAQEAFDDDEVPVGAVIVRNGEIVATGTWNISALVRSSVESTLQLSGIAASKCFIENGR